MLPGAGLPASRFEYPRTDAGSAATGVIPLPAASAPSRQDLTPPLPTPISWEAGGHVFVDFRALSLGFHRSFLATLSSLLRLRGPATCLRTPHESRFTARS